MAEADEGAKPLLSPRERQVLELLALGYIDKQVGLSLGITLGTIRVYRKRIVAKLGVRGLGPTLLVAGRLKEIDLEGLADEAMALRRDVRPVPETEPEG